MMITSMSYDLHRNGKRIDDMHARKFASLLSLVLGHWEWV